MDFMNLGLNDWVTCPFDPVHRMKYSKFHNHFVKCKKSHPDDKRKQCPYNASELIELEEYENHLAECPYKALYVNLGQGKDDLPDYDAPSHFDFVEEQSVNKMANFDSDEEIDSVSIAGKNMRYRHYSHQPVLPNVGICNDGSASENCEVASLNRTVNVGEKSLERKGFGRGAWIKQMMEKQKSLSEVSSISTVSVTSADSTTTSNTQDSTSKLAEYEKLTNLIRRFKEHPVSIDQEFGRGRGAIFRALLQD